MQGVLLRRLADVEPQVLEAALSLPSLQQMPSSLLYNALANIMAKYNAAAGLGSSERKAWRVVAHKVGSSCLLGVWCCRVLPGTLRVLCLLLGLESPHLLLSTCPVILSIFSILYSAVVRKHCRVTRMGWHIGFWPANHADLSLQSAGPAELGCWFPGKAPLPFAVSHASAAGQGPCCRSQPSAGCNSCERPQGA